jgi:hypothetical protein
MPRVEIVLESGTDRSGRCVRLRGKRVLFGTSRRCSIRLTDPAASDEHAALMLDGGIWYVRDLGSRDGTFVNGYPIRSIELHLGDVIRFGERGATVRIQGLDPALPDDHVPVLEPLAGPPTEAGLRRGRCWFGLVVLALLAAGLLLTGLVGSDTLRPVARAETPEELHGIVTGALRERHLENVLDILTARQREEVERSLPGAGSVGVREAVRRAGRSGALVVDGWGTLVGVFFSDLRQSSATMVTETLEGARRPWRIVRESGRWSLDENPFRLKLTPDADR